MDNRNPFALRHSLIQFKKNQKSVSSKPSHILIIGLNFNLRNCNATKDLFLLIK